MAHAGKEKDMVRKYSKEELKNKLHRALYTVVMNEGIEGVTVRKISKTSDLSDPYIYQCYKNLGDLMADAFLEIDREVAQLVEELLGDGEFRKKMESNPEECCWTMWNAYWKFLMKDPEKTVFYWRYYQSARYTKEFLEIRRGVLSQFVTYMEKMGQAYGIKELTDPEVLVSNIIDSTVSVAVKMHLGYMKQTDLKAHTVYQSVFALLFHMLQVDVWDESYICTA